MSQVELFPGQLQFTVHCGNVLNGSPSGVIDFSQLGSVF
jgi:hypothetical protein